MINAIIRFFGFYDRNGLKYSNNQLIKAKYWMHKWPIEEQAKYADEVCVNSMNGYFMNKQILSLKEEGFDYTNLNATAIGNMAYIYLNTTNEEVRQVAKEWIKGREVFLNSFEKSIKQMSPFK